MKGDDGRAYIVAENSDSIRWTGSGILTEDGQEKGQLEIIGTVRGGGTLSADRLVHIPGSGDYQVAAVCTSGVRGLQLCLTFLNRFFQPRYLQKGNRPKLPQTTLSLYQLKMQMISLLQTFPISFRMNKHGLRKKKWQAVWSAQLENLL